MWADITVTVSELTAILTAVGTLAVTLLGALCGLLLTFRREEIKNLKDAAQNQYSKLEALDAERKKAQEKQQEMYEDMAVTAQDYRVANVKLQIENDSLRSENTNLRLELEKLRSAK